MAPKRKKTDEEKAFLKNRVHGSVICKLSRICKYEPIVDEIQRSARELKQCQLEAWHVANVHVLRCLEEKLPLPSFDKTFFNRCCAGVMKEAEDKDREKRAQPPSSSKPRKQQRTMTSQSVAATEEEEDARDDSQRKNARAQVEDAELINTFCLFWEQRASNPAYEPPSLEFSGAIRKSSDGEHDQHDRFTVSPSPPPIHPVSLRQSGRAAVGHQGHESPRAELLPSQADPCSL
jgi:hypothetical protein